MPLGQGEEVELLDHDGIVIGGTLLEQKPVLRVSIWESPLNTNLLDAVHGLLAHFEKVVEGDERHEVCEKSVVIAGTSSVS